MKWNMKFNLWKPDAPKVVIPKKVPIRREIMPVMAWSPPRRSQDGWKFIKALEKRGFIILGQGFYSSVLWKKGDRVIKVSSGIKHDAWIDYVLWASQKGYAGTLAPKVYSYKKIGDFYVAVMEKMAVTAMHVNCKEDHYIYPQLLTMVTQYGNNKAAEFLEQVVPGARKFAYDLKDFAGNNGFDLHNENIMFRLDGSMVITDPVSFVSSLTINRLKAWDFGPVLAIR